MKAGRELDALVAERVMGLPAVQVIRAAVENTGFDEIRGWFDCPTDQDEESAYGAMDKPGGKHLKFWMPREYSSSMADAWPVVEKLLSEGWQVTLQYVANKWNCHFWRLPLDVTMTDEKIGVEYIESVTEVICLAALRVKGVEL